MASKDARGDCEGVLDSCADGEATRAVAEALLEPRPAVDEGMGVAET